MDRTVSMRCSFYAGMDIGRDSGTTGRMNARHGSACLDDVKRCRVQPGPTARHALSQ